MTTLIKVGDNYGLCNRLFPFANLIAASAEYGFRIEHAGFSEFSDFFVGTCGQKIPVFQAGSGGRLQRRPLVPGYHFRRRVARKLGIETSIILGTDDVMDFSLPASQDKLRLYHVVQLNGLYFFDSVAFETHADLIRRYFSPVEKLSQQISELIWNCRTESDLLIGVHIRHGDYKTFADGLMYYTFAEYRELMQQVARLFPGRRISFLICSNAEIDLSDFGQLSVTVAPGHPVVDLYALASCDMIIGPRSTYSEWASFYGGVPRYQHRKNGYLRNGKEWPGVSVEDFKVHTTGFGRCETAHVLPLR
ncbi:MAG: hypothetical protein KDA81_09790 [Planctomycetaceae bacterium]|nr:hypothetical protein [Planctomycetaceae bacterium]MCA9084336.1 hypothetical protein [Planctomycetaceae bacterium]